MNPVWIIFKINIIFISMHSYNLIFNIYCFIEKGSHKGKSAYLELMKVIMQSCNSGQVYCFKILKHIIFQIMGHYNI